MDKSAHTQPQQRTQPTPWTPAWHGPAQPWQAVTTSDNDSSDPQATGSKNQASPRPQQQLQSTEQARTILFAEDDPDDQYLIHTALQSIDQHIKLVCMNNGADMMDYLSNAAHKPDIILLDLNMPGLDGKQLLERLKTSEQFYQIPVIIYSTSSAEQDVASCYRLGANAYIVKPMRFDDIKALVQSLCDYWFNIVKLNS